MSSAEESREAERKEVSMYEETRTVPTLSESTEQVVWTLVVTGDSGRRSLQEIEEQIGPLPRTTTLANREGALAFLFRGPDDSESEEVEIAAGVELLKIKEDNISIHGFEPLQGHSRGDVTAAKVPEWILQKTGFGSDRIPELIEAMESLASEAQWAWAPSFSDCTEIAEEIAGIGMIAGRLQELADQCWGIGEELCNDAEELREMMEEEE